MQAPPVFRYGVALLSALTLGPLLESAFWAAIYADIPSSNLLPMIVCMAIAGGNPTMVSRRAARKFNSRYSAGSMAVWPVSMAHSVAMPKNSSVIISTVTTVLTTATRSKNPQPSAFLYQKRHSESAGDVVAFQWLRPVFRYGSALLGGLTVGRLLFEVFWETLFQRGYSSSYSQSGT